MNKHIFTIMAAIITVGVTATISASSEICYGTVYDNGMVVSGASVHCEHSAGGWCGDTYWPNTTTTLDGCFDISAHYPEDQAGYYNLCIIYGSKRAHVLNFYSNMITSGNLGNVSLQGGAHPSHNTCQ